MIKALNHTGFVVRDRDAAVAFYRDVVGLSVISEYGRRGPGVDQVVGYQGTELRSAVLDLGGGHILELIQYISPAPAERPSEERNVLGAAHLAFEVEDIEETFRRLERGGARVMKPAGRAGARPHRLLPAGPGRQLAGAASAGVRA